MMAWQYAIGFISVFIAGVGVTLIVSATMLFLVAIGVIK
ncbi:hypothetical protein UFOVP191_45 [uncultured Caudovirales phage]|uniref:Uncharacterized protein n=1 Tax=uncultured Caudovirales phage TaxID=2100421 RepID=A0A6J7WJ43_9CAUD|nr:hypothetical protein UFOVP191_45 [uncultured Caudovirales phage]